MASRTFKNKIDTETMDRIAVAEFDVTYPRIDGNTNRAQITISTRKPEEREDEVELWLELLGEIPGCAVEYVQPRSRRGGGKIVILVDEVQVVQDRQREMEFQYV